MPEGVRRYSEGEVGSEQKSIQSKTQKCLRTNNFVFSDLFSVICYLIFPLFCGLGFFLHPLFLFFRFYFVIVCGTLLMFLYFEGENKETMKKNRDTYFYKTFFTLFGTVALQNLIVFSVNLADSIMLGSYSETAMSGVSLANQIQYLLQFGISGFANGLQVIASQYWGKKETPPIKRVFSAAVLTACAAAAAMSIAVYAFPGEILGILSNEEAIVGCAVEYIKIMSLTYVIFAFTTILTAYMRSVESTAIGFVSSALALVTNVFLNYLLIFGNLGCPEMGAKGAAYATFASRVVELTAVVIYVFFIDKKLKTRVRDIFSCGRSYFCDYIKTGLPLVGSGSSWGVAMTVQTAIIGRLGAAAIGANAVAAPVFQVVSVLYGASGTASSVLIGKTVGENDTQRVKRYTKKLQVMFIITGLVSCGCLLLMKNTILGIYDISEETRALASSFISILAVTIIGSSYEAPCLCGIVSGGGDTKFVLINDLIFMWLIVLPMSMLSAFVFKWSVPVTFFILKSDQITKCAVAVVKVNRYKWIRKLTRS